MGFVSPVKSFLFPLRSIFDFDFGPELFVQGQRCLAVDVFLWFCRTSSNSLDALFGSHGFWSAESKPAVEVKSAKSVSHLAST